MIRLLKGPIRQPSLGYWVAAVILTVLLIPVMIFIYDRALGLDTWMSVGRQGGWEVDSYWLHPLDPAQADHLVWTDTGQTSPSGRWCAAFQTDRMGTYLAVTDSQTGKMLTEFSPNVANPNIDRLAWVDDDTIAIHQTEGYRVDSEPPYQPDVEPHYVIWKWRVGYIAPDAVDDFLLKAVVIFALLTLLLAHGLRVLVRSIGRVGRLLRRVTELL